MHPVLKLLARNMRALRVARGLSQSTLERTGRLSRGYVQGRHAKRARNKVK